MSEEPPSRRSVRDFCKHYGLTRNRFLTVRAKAKIMPKAYDSMLSVMDQDALLRYLSAERRTDQAMRRIREQPTVTKQFVPPPTPSIDYEAEKRRIADSLTKWRTTLVGLAKGHVADDGSGRCARCYVDAPCQTKKDLIGLDSELVEEIAVADSGDLADESVPDTAPERQLSHLYNARNRWMRALTKLTIEHMIDDYKGRCPQCGVAAPCDMKKAVARINRGIARRIETFAAMDDGELEAALGDRRRTDYADSDWDAM